MSSDCSYKIIHKITNAFKKYHFRINIGVYIGSTIIAWIIFFFGLIPLSGLLLCTFGMPLLLYSVYYIRRLDSVIIYKLVWIIGGGSFIGGIMALGIGSITFAQPWTPLYNFPSIIKNIYMILMTIFSWILGGYLSYLWGKRRGFKLYY
ncbi:MAG: hypothetical protein ACFFBP_01915 [Promethearchaeota archaeon]